MEKLDTLVELMQEQNTVVLPNKKKLSVKFDWSRKLIPSNPFRKHTLKNLAVTQAKPKKWKKIAIGFVAVLTVILIAVGSVGAHTWSVVSAIQADAQLIQATATKAKDQLKAQNLPATKEAILEMKTQLSGIEQKYQKIQYYKFIPIANLYYNDGIHGLNAGKAGLDASEKVIDAIVPYADVLGFAGEGSFTGGTAEDRIRLLLETLEKISPVLDDIVADFATAESELAQINPDRYPVEFKGIQVRSLIETGKVGVGEVVTAINEYRPALEVLPEIAGSNKQRKKYLVIFQNDNELRPTGGFMTAYAVMFIEDGKVYPEKSDDIYELDKKFTKRIPIPEELGRYLTTEKYFNLRDMNIDPDFKVSMDTFLSHYQEVPGEPGDIDGIIAVDTNVLAQLVQILGPVEVPGFGTFSADIDERCDCPQIIYILSEIVDRPTPYLREDRKGIIAPMMQAILQKAYSAPKEVWPQLFALARDHIEAKHVQMYFFTAEHQTAAEAVNVAGRLIPPPSGYDYLGVVDANLGGAKSNLFVEQEAVLTTSPVVDGKVTHTLTLKYRNDHKPDNCNLEAGQLCLNGELNDWVRIYVPNGAELIESNGFKEEIKTSEYLSWKIFEGSFSLSPLSNSTVVLNYTVPYENQEEYKIMIRKQAGTDNFKYLLDVDGHEEEVILSKDQKITIPF